MGDDWIRLLDPQNQWNGSRPIFYPTQLLMVLKSREPVYSQRLSKKPIKSFQNIGVSSRTLSNCLRCLSVHLKCLLFPSRKLAAWPLKMGWASQKEAGEAGSSPNYHSCQGFLLLVAGAGNCKLVNFARFLKHHEGITTTSCGPILPSYKCITLINGQKWMSFTGVISPLQVEFLGPYLLVRFSPTSTHTTDLQAFLEVHGLKWWAKRWKAFQGNSYIIYFYLYIYIYLYRDRYCYIINCCVSQCMRCITIGVYVF